MDSKTDNSNSDIKKSVKEKKLTPMEQLMKKMNISETNTKPIKYKFPKVKNQVFPENGYNYQADLLQLPTTQGKSKRDRNAGYHMLLVVDDIYSNYLDFEPLKSKSAEDVLQAFKTIFKRGIVPEPKASLRTDNGSEFKSVVDKYMHDHNILHLWSIVDRHKQTGNIENANRQIGRVIMTYLTKMSIETGDDYNEWTDIIDELRHGLNDMKKHPKDVDLEKYTPKDINLDHDPKYKVGDMVYRRSEAPVDKFGNKLANSKFRQGDLQFNLNEPRKIVRVVIYSSPNPWRYILAGLPNVSYAEAEIIPAKETEEKRIVNKIIDKMKKDKIVYYKVWFKKELKKDALWLAKDQLLEDGLDEYIQEYEDS